MSGDVVDLAARRDEPAPAGLQLVTVVAYGGIPLARMINVVDEGGVILFSSVRDLEDDEAVAAEFQRLCEILAAAFDDEAGSYHLEPVRVDEQGRRLLPGATS